MKSSAMSGSEYEVHMGGDIRNAKAYTILHFTPENATETLIGQEAG
jgi:hypothetical protein